MKRYTAYLAIPLGMLTLLATVASAAQSEAAASGGEARQAALEIFGSIPGGWASVELAAWSKGGRDGALDESSNQIRLGSEQRYSYRAAEDAYLTVIHLDPHGVATVVLPTARAQDAYLAAGEEFGQALEAAPPLGRVDLFVYATREPLTLQDLGFPEGTPDYPIVDSSRVAAFAETVRNALAALPADSVATARVRGRMIGRKDETQLAALGAGDGTTYTADDIVAYFTAPRTRAIRRTALDVSVEFPLDSATLTPDAKLELDQVGEALARSELVSKSFEVGGHTCDLGPSAYNDDLSRRRAESVRSYLVKAHGIDADRLVARGYGETMPLEVGTTEDIRKHNRRVEFTLDSNGTH